MTYNQTKQGVIVVVDSGGSRNDAFVVFRPQSMILTLYGDYIRHRGGEIWVASLIQVLSSFGLSEQAIRSALSRMTRKGLLQTKRVGKNSYYTLTRRGREMLDVGARRIFQRHQEPWDGQWDVVTYSIPERRREVRDRLRQDLLGLGYGTLSNATWICPYDRRQEVMVLANVWKVADCIQVFRAQYQGPGSLQDLVHRCWNMEKTRQKCAAFLERYRPRYEGCLRRLEAGDPPGEQECFIERFMLIHEYRRFSFFDPQLPKELVPQGWLGSEAAALFQSYHNLLAEGANRYFDSLFQAKPKASPQALVSA
ncbi:MAG: phenylacetic acid degradation operon negative regulatory protein PaaX [Chloroflexi bacterium]|nr:phenylacetic acid degradation operon negative regulatory protein PaaX [Chloroflexota bacterium]